jgi:hypothetical protein
MRDKDLDRLYEIAGFLRDLADADKTVDPKYIIAHYQLLMKVLEDNTFAPYNSDTKLLKEYEEYLSGFKDRGAELHTDDLVRGFFIKDMNEKE